MGDDDQRPGLPASAGHRLTARVAAGAGPEAKMLIGRPDDPHNPCRVAAVKGLSFRLGVDRGTHLGQRPRAALTGRTHDRDRTAPAFFRPHPLHHRGRPHALHLLSNTRSEPSTGEFFNGIQQFWKVRDRASAHVTDFTFGGGILAYSSHRRRFGRREALMGSVWTCLRKPSNQHLLAWLGGGAVVIISGIWAVVIYVWPAHESPTAVCADQGIAIGGNVSGSKINNKVSGGTATAGPCVTSTKK